MESEIKAVEREAVWKEERDLKEYWDRLNRHLLCSSFQNLQSEFEKTKLKYQDLEKQKTESQGKLDDLDQEVR